MLTSLTKLTLAHNLIERIENLELLTGLNELDLSFNKIEKIENLDQLVNLEIVTLFHNKIRKMENMDTLEKLLVFSIGDNLIEDYKEVKVFIQHSSPRQMMRTLPLTTPLWLCIMSKISFFNGLK